MLFRSGRFEACFTAGSHPSGPARTIPSGSGRLTRPELTRPMDSETFRRFCRKRSERARTLSESRPEAAAPLSFLAEVAEAQASSRLSLASLVSLVRSKGPERLRETAETLDETAIGEAMARYRSREDTSSPGSFFARVLLQPEMAGLELGEASSTSGCCPRCGHLPQVGCLRSEGDEIGRAHV